MHLKRFSRRSIKPNNKTKKNELFEFSFKIDVVTLVAVIFSIYLSISTIQNQLNLFEIENQKDSLRKLNSLVIRYENSTTNFEEAFNFISDAGRIPDELNILLNPEKLLYTHWSILSQIEHILSELYFYNTDLSGLIQRFVNIERHISQNIEINLKKCIEDIDKCDHKIVREAYLDMDNSVNEISIMGSFDIESISKILEIYYDSVKWRKERSRKLRKYLHEYAINSTNTTIESKELFIINRKDSMRVLNIYNALLRCEFIRQEVSSKCTEK